MVVTMGALEMVWQWRDLPDTVTTSSSSSQPGAAAMAVEAPGVVAVVAGLAAVEEGQEGLGGGPAVAREGPLAASGSRIPLPLSGLHLPLSPPMATQVQGVACDEPKG